MIRELDSVALTCDRAEFGLRLGDVGTVVLVHDGRGYEVEFLTLSGETLAVLSLGPGEVRAVGRGEIAHARAIEALSQR